MNPFTPSFDALEFPTSPLPPSSPLPSSTVHGSLHSLCPVPHLNEGTHLDFDTTPARGSCGADSSARSSYRRPMTLDSASESLPVRHLSYSRGIHKVPTPHFMPSSSKADIILELLARDHPWNAIGDMLGLPPIPTANETYLKEIASHRTVFSRTRLAASFHRRVVRGVALARNEQVARKLMYLETNRIKITDSLVVQPRTVACN